MENKKSKLYLIVKALLILICIFLIFCTIAVPVYFIFITKCQKQVSYSNSKAIIAKDELIEYGSSLKYDELVSKLVDSKSLSDNTDVEIFVDDKLISPDEQYTFDKLDEVLITVKTTTKSAPNETITKQITWKVQDTQKPVLSGVHNLQISEGSKLDIKSGITAKDSVDGELEVKIEGNYDINKAGEYDLVAKAIDKSGNEVEKNFKVTVTKKEVPETDKKEDSKTTDSSSKTTDDKKQTSTTSSTTSKSSTSSSSSKKSTSSSSTKKSASSNSSKKSTSSSSSKKSASSSSPKKSTSSSSSKKSSSSSSSKKSTSSSSSKKSTSSSSSKKSNSSSSTKKSSSSSSSKKSSASSTKEGRLALAKAEAKKVVKKIIKSGMKKSEKAEAICIYITNTVSVQSNQSSEAYKTNYGNEAYAALILKKAACSGRCKAVTLLCDAAGLKSKHINQNQWTHQWNKIQVEGGKWLVIDAQIGFVGDRHPLE